MNIKFTRYTIPDVWLGISGEFESCDPFDKQFILNSLTNKEDNNRVEEVNGHIIVIKWY